MSFLRRKANIVFRNESGKKLFVLKLTKEEYNSIKRACDYLQIDMQKFFDDLLRDIIKNHS